MNAPDKVFRRYMVLHMTPPRLTADEIERYARHIVLPEIGGAGPAEAEAARGSW